MTKSVIGILNSIEIYSGHFCLLTHHFMLCYDKHSHSYNDKHTHSYNCASASSDFTALYNLFYLLTYLLTMIVTLIRTMKNTHSYNIALPE